MKKSLLLFLIVGWAVIAPAQELPQNDTGKIVYEEVVEVEGATKEQLYRQGRKWFAETYTDGQDEDVIYLQDSYLGEIGANPFLWIEVTPVGKPITAGAVIYDIKLSIKEGRYKYKITNLYHESQGSRLGSGGALENKEPECGLINMRQEYWEEIKRKTDEMIKELISSLKTQMTEAPKVGAEEDDW